MSFDLKAVQSYGAGTDVYDAAKALKFNSYAQVTAISQDSLTISTEKYIAGSYQTFGEGDEILIHICAVKTGSDTAYLGKYLVATINSVEVNATAKTKILTLNKDPLSFIDNNSMIMTAYAIQAITIPSFSSLSMAATDVISPTVFNATNYIGGVLAFKVAGEFSLNGGKIKLTDLGIPVANKTLRPTLTQEESGKGLQDYQLWAGHENWYTRDHLVLNSGDGAAFIIAQTIVGDENSRIGDPDSYGVQFCRGASDSVGGKPANTTNIGGSTILIAGESFSNFSPKIISKYRAANATAGQGLARCYIALKDTTLRIDEGLYSFDIISDPSRVASSLNIKSFGSGSLGDAASPTAQLNNYAKITAVSVDGYRLTYTGKTTSGIATIDTGAMVMIHSSQTLQTTTEVTSVNVGKFKIATVLADNGTTLTLDTSVSDIINTAQHSCQIVSIPQFQNFTLSATNSATPKFNNNIGGIFAIAVKGTCNLSNGAIDVELKGGGNGYGSAGLATIGNAQNSTKLPLGQGNGSVFILANKLVMNSQTRIGATHSGALFGGAGQQRGGAYNAVYQSGYRGANYEVYGGSPFQQNQGARPGVIGGNGMNNAGTYTTTGWYGAQGAHVMVIADTIEGFNLAAISTGGLTRPYVGYGGRTGTAQDVNGGASYGSGGTDNGYGASSGGFIGAGGGGGGGDPICGGGSGGFAFIYYNNDVNSSQDGLTI